MGTSLEQQAILRDFLEYERQLQDLLLATHNDGNSARRSHNPLVSRLEKLSSQLAIQVGQGERFDQACDAASEFSLPLRLSWNAWLATNRSPESFDILQPPVAKIPGQRRIWFLPVQLAILLLLALGILTYWNEFAARTLLAIYRDSDLQPGVFVTLFQQVSAIPSWCFVGILALLFTGTFAAFRRIQSQGVASSDGLESLPVEVKRWQEGRFLELLTQHDQSIDDAAELYRRLAHTKAGEVEGPTPSSVAGSLHPGWIIAWGSELAFEKKMQFRLSSMPTMAFLSLSGLIVFGVATIVFGSVFELLYALVPAGAFSR